MADGSQFVSARVYAVVERAREESRVTLRRRVLQALARAYAPPPKRSVSEWADEERFLSAESSAEPGRWKTSRVEPSRGVMDAFSDPMVEKVTVMACTQFFKTETINNVVGFFASGDPAPMLIIQPTLEMGEAWSKDRLAPMIRDTPALTDLFSTKSRDAGDTILHKSFPGGRVNIAGANSPASLASRPVRIVLADEVDRYEASAGREGDPVMLAEERTTTFWNRKIGLFSTPTIKGASRIEASFLEGDQRRFHVSCPHCAHETWIQWKHVKWPEGRPEEAAIFCEACGAEWSEAERLDAVNRGRWVAHAPFKGHASFHINKLASPWVTIAKLVKQFLEAKPFPDRLKVWINTTLAETWEDGGERVKPDALISRREDYAASPLPEGVGLVTAAVDIQDNRWECEIVGWGAHEERWSLEYVVHYADPSTPGYWAALDDVLLRVFDHPLGIRLAIDTTCVDSGGHHTQKVYDFARDRFSRRVFAIKGVAGPSKPIWPKKATRNAAKKTDVFLVGVDQAKSVMQARLLIRDRGPGFCHFPKRDVYDEAYFDGLTCEKAITKYKNGNPYKVWEKPERARNEPWDCAVYNYAARVSSPVDVEKRLASLKAANENAKATPGPAAKPRVAPSRRVRSSGVAA